MHSAVYTVAPPLRKILRSVFTAGRVWVMLNGHGAVQAVIIPIRVPRISGLGNVSGRDVSIIVDTSLSSNTLSVPGIDDQ